jgi:hypothetical protein
VIFDQHSSFVYTTIMVSFFRKGAKQAAQEPPATTVNSSSLPDEQTTMTSTLLDTQAFPSSKVADNDEKHSHHHHDEHLTDADQQSFHSLEGVDSRKFGTVGSPMSDLKKPLPDHEVTDAPALQDATNEKAVAGGQEADDSDRGYLHGVQLWLVYISMLLCIFLVSLDFTIL